MRSLDETKVRWQETIKHSANFADLQRAVKFNGPSSPCVAGCRSVCWKAFLLFQAAPAASWSLTLLESRTSYGTLRDHHLLYIKHPEKLAELSLDPLADVPESPWDAFRQDELVRAEILQDVRRLPDEPSFYHEPATQTMILDVLFLYCKAHPESGGYRQGMHELLAPIVYVVHQDALDRAAATSAADGLADPAMAEMLDSSFVEHDSFTLFSAVMARARAFYEVGGAPSNVPEAGAATPAGQGEPSAIVERSRQIHEVTLMRVDPELASHLKTIEILPQIFLIRWIRLLFGREFPFEQQLVLWDTLFAFDPTLELIDLICVAMLVRIRWSLLDMDYSSALQTLLKYPAPQPPHGPHTFVDDAIYLRDHLTAAGGSALVMKYTGRAPPTPPASTPGAGSRSSTPGLAGGLAGLRPRTLGARSSPLPSSSPSPLAAARLMQQQASVEALFQGAAKNFLERGERLGLNQAVRDAVGEIRRNVQQGIQEARKAAAASSTAAARNAWSVSPLSRERGAAALAKRNRQLAALLDETVAELRALAGQATKADTFLDDSSRQAHRSAIETAAARVQFVQVYLDDSTLLLPDEEPSRVAVVSAAGRESTSTKVALDSAPVVASTAAVLDAVRDNLKATAAVEANEGGSRNPSRNGAAGAGRSEPFDDALFEEPELEETTGNAHGDRMDMDGPEAAAETATKTSAPAAAGTPASEAPPVVAVTTNQRPTAPIPTRSTIAQSSFAWMLEPDTPPSSASAATASASATPAASSLLRSSRGSPFSSSAPPSHRKRLSANGGGSSAASSSRERNAFLFGEVVTPGNDTEGRRWPPTSEEIFGLEPLSKALPRVPSP